jgi:hypothetical protein
MNDNLKQTHIGKTKMTIQSSMGDCGTEDTIMHRLPVNMSNAIGGMFWNL